MRLHVRGKSIGVVDTIVGRIVRDVNSINEQSILVAQDDSPIHPLAERAAAVISRCRKQPLELNRPVVYDLPSVDHLELGDLVSIDRVGNVNTLYRINSTRNSILVTEMCNSKCVMCSQPPKKRDDRSYLFEVHNKLIPLIPKDCVELGITGGEPSLLGDRLFQLLKLVAEELPETGIHVLTNGRRFAWSDFAAKVEEIDASKVVWGIPLYSDYYALHDYIVQAESAFYQTVRGMHNLARLGQAIEIRVVLHKLTVARLHKLAQFIYRNLPFVEHVAFMGLENTGFTPYNSELLWMDPYGYREELREAVLYLHSFGMNVSIYNHQLCTLPAELWRFTRKSISEWKNIYLEQCNHCKVRSRCGGFFESAAEMHSSHVASILSEVHVAG